MKIALINPSLLSNTIGHYNKSLEKNRGIYPPLGICYVSASLKAMGHEVCVYDIDVEERNVIEKIVLFDPKVIGIYTMTWTFKNSIELLKVLKEKLPEAKFIAGGPNVTAFPRETVEIGGFDYAIKGEGEEVINNVLVGKYNERIISSSLIDDIDSIPMPDLSWINFGNYFDVFTRHNQFATMITSRGCPYGCIYCDRNNRMGKKWRQHSPKRIVEEILHLTGSYGIREIMFFDDEFIIDKERIYELCNLILEKDIEIDWECRARVDQVDENLLKSMKKAGCYRIRFGFESGSDRILKILKKGITVKQSIECARITKKVGMESFGYFMAGCPEETESELNETLNLSLSLGIDYSIFSQAVMIPGSELFDWGVRNNKISRTHWIDYLKGIHDNGSPTISSDTLPTSLVKEKINKANKLFYSRVSFIFKELLKLRNLNQLKRKYTMARALL